MYKPKVFRVFFGGLTALFLVAAAYFGRGLYRGTMTIHQLLGEILFARVVEVLGRHPGFQAPLRITGP